MDDYPVQLLDNAANTAAEATLRASLTADVVIATEALWKPYRQAIPQAEHSHWDWSLKTGRLVIPGARIMGVEYRGVIEGMGFVFEQSKFARLPPVVGRPLVYVDFLETAPWNLRLFGANPRFRGVGAKLMAVAVRLSESLGYEGRVGLHALQQAEDFYVQKCQMSTLGPDPQYYGLWYFEWVTDAARRFTAEERI